MQSVLPLSSSSNWNGDANIVISIVLVRIDYQWIRSTLKKLGALSICMENPLIAGIIQLERFIPVDIFHKKKERMERMEILYTFCLINQCQASS